MKIYTYLIGLAFTGLLISCGKSGSTSNPEPTKPEPQITTSGNTTTYPSGYVVKTLGFSRIVLGVDANDKLTVAELYGGGNKVVLKAGTGNIVEMIGNGGFSTLPAQFGPDGYGKVVEETIDNGKMPSDTTGNQAITIRIKGFDKTKTGYNQLNLVMHKMVRIQATGFDTNIAFFKYNSGKTYSGASFKSLFTGNIQVTDVQIAAPVSAKPYVTEDHVVYLNNGAYNATTNQAITLDLKSDTYVTNTSYQNLGTIGSNFKYEWVNANNGAVTRYDEYSFNLIFSNIKADDEVVLASDSTKYAFLRITGFDPAKVGYNQLRLFIGSKGKTYDGSIPFFATTKQATMPTLAAAKNMLIAGKLYTNYAAPVVYHY
ncbi:hypothetical protein ACFQ3S_14970 [Mucilaginibacter terrae]|uniref:hypothetical protein n=1 Tax=Mucilaginibacter terrae TaxID=1955052 RepID=UPI003636E082